MYPVDLPQYRARLTAWERAPRAERLVRLTRDDRGRPCREHWALGKCFARVVDVGGGMAELYADKGLRQRVPDQGRISFGTWDEAERVFGVGGPHGMPMVPRK
jgi:hypothetical protein